MVDDLPIFSLPIRVSSTPITALIRRAATSPRLGKNRKFIAERTALSVGRSVEERHSPRQCASVSTWRSPIAQAHARTRAGRSRETPHGEASPASSRGESVPCTPAERPDRGGASPARDAREGADLVARFPFHWGELSRISLMQLCRSGIGDVADARSELVVYCTYIGCGLASGSESSLTILGRFSPC